MFSTSLYMGFLQTKLVKNIQLILVLFLYKYYFFLLKLW